MSAVAPNFGDDQPVVGEPASHRHQAVVVGEPPEDEAPVVGEPAFPNGLQDQQLISPSAVDMTSANGIQSSQHTPLHEDSSVSSSHVSAPPSASPVQESPNVQQVPVTMANPGIRDGVTHETETPITESSIASSDVEAADALNTPDAAASVNEVQEVDIPEDSEVTHIEDEPHLPRSAIPTENPFAALEEGEASEESNADMSITPEEISSKGLVDEQPQASSQSAVEEKQSAEHSVLAQTEADSGSVEGSQAITEDNDSDVKDANVDQNDPRAEHTLTPASDQASITETVQENKTESIDTNDRSVDIPKETEVTFKEMQHGLSEAVPEPEDSSVKSSTQKDVDDVPINPDLNNDKESFVEAQLMESSETLPGTRGIAVEECLANQSPANGDNTHQHDGDGDHASERGQDLPNDKVDDASTVCEKPNSGIKFPLIFTGLAIAVVGVAVAAFSRSR